MIKVCGKDVTFQKSHVGYWPIVSEGDLKIKLPLLLEEYELESITEILKQIPKNDCSLDITAMIVAGAISLRLKYAPVA